MMRASKRIKDREAILKALEAEGWRQAPHPSRRHIKLVHSIAAERLPFWVDRYSSLRRGRSLKDSCTVNERRRRELVALGETL